jgi:cytoskeletal protein CcmA (bactofilin family)
MVAEDDKEYKKTEPKVAYIGEGVVFKGEIAAPETVIVDGSVEGELSARCVRVGVSGSLKGSITVTDADIQGTVTDKLEVKQLLIIRSTGRVEANVSYGELQIEKGAIITGAVSSTDVRSAKTSDQSMMRAKLAPVAPATSAPTLELKRTATPSS